LVDVIPSRFDLENRISEAGTIGAVLRLDRVMDGVDDDHDVTLFDCPPSLGHLTQLALAASHGALCVLEPEYDGLDGAIRLRDFVRAESNRKALSNPDLTVFGYIVNRLRANLGAHNVQLDALPVIFGADLVWTPNIPERAAEKDASDSELPLRLVGTSEARKQAGLWSDHAARLISIGAPA
jgi:chromosome partitioning protein